MESGDRHEGYLTKKGQIRRNWKRRYFQLNNGVLYYFSKSHPGSPLQQINSPNKRGSIRLGKPDKGKEYGCITVNGSLCAPLYTPKYSNAFQIVTNQRTYFLFADSAAEYLVWKDKLMRNGATWTELQNIYNDDDDPNTTTSPSMSPSSSESSFSSSNYHINNNSSSNNNNHHGTSNGSTDALGRLLLEVYKSFKKASGNIQNIKEYLVSSQHSTLFSFDSATAKEKELFWKFFDFPPNSGIALLGSESCTHPPYTQACTLTLKYNGGDGDGVYVGKVLFVKENSWKIVDEDWTEAR